MQLSSACPTTSHHLVGERQPRCAAGMAYSLTGHRTRLLDQTASASRRLPQTAAVIAIVESTVSNLLPFADTNELFATFGFRLDLNTAAPRFLINRKCWYRASNIESCLQVCLPWPSAVWQPHKMCLSVSLACEHRWQVASVILFQYLSTLEVGSTSSVAARLNRHFLQT